MPSAAQTDSRWFGGGYIYGVQTIAPGGSPPSILLPTQFVTIQEASVDFTFSTKELRGILMDPEDIAITTRKISGKITTGRVNLKQLNDMIFAEPGGNFAPGTVLLANNEPAIVPATTFQITVMHAAAFYQDLGVFYAGTRNQLVPVSSAPTQGQYTYNPSTGVYTFSAADVGVSMLTSYRYSSPSTGHTLTLHNLVMGSGIRPTFEALFQNPNDGDQELLLYQCICSSLKVPLKTEDYVKLEIDFQAYANNSYQVAQFLSAY
jgi:hypothetical protein